MSVRSSFIPFLFAATPWLVGADGCFGSSAEEEDTACDEAKQHVCDNIEGQACSTATMGDAMQKVRDACGDEAADAFVPKVEAACEDNALGECLTL